MNLPGIIKGTKFGERLEELAKEAEVIVEFGTAWGRNSTMCLRRGLVRPTQRIWTVEVSPAKWVIAKEVHKDEPRITCLVGHLLPVEAYPKEKQELFKDCQEMFGKSQLDKDALPQKVDLCLFDGGGPPVTEPEFLAFWPRCKVVALDDTNKDMDRKCSRIRKAILESPGWEVLNDEFYDRTGWLVAKPGKTLKSLNECEV